jgi:hypothetical protein
MAGDDDAAMRDAAEQESAETSIAGAVESLRRDVVISVWVMDEIVGFGFRHFS